MWDDTKIFTRATRMELSLTEVGKIARGSSLLGGGRGGRC